jgi:hypothetical protein
LEKATRHEFDRDEIALDEALEKLTKRVEAARIAKEKAVPAGS